MQDYTKFRLKNDDELIALLDGKDNLLVISCNKCFKEFTAQKEPEPEMFTALAAVHAKTIISSIRADFLCNETIAAKIFESSLTSQVENIIIISCGLGVQTAADLVSLPVCTAADSISPADNGGNAALCHHSLALTDIRCQACGQCYLSRTGGICPVADCAKSLINGQCGGSDNGKCEVPEDKDCAWERIYKALTATGQLSVMRDNSVSLHDYSKVSFALIDRYVKSVRSKRLEGFFGGLYPHECKSAGGHLEPGVIQGSKSIKQSQSGGKNINPDNLSADEIISIVKEKGIVGMGGAGFPAHIKLKPPKPIDTVILNGCECEPLLTADHCVMLNFPDGVISGLEIILKVTGAVKGIIAIEDNKPDAINLLSKKTALSDNINVVAVPSKYPQGAEKMLIKRVLGLVVPSGGLPFDAGVIVCNVSTAKAVSDAVMHGLSLTERIVTVAGEGIRKPGNYVIKLGTTLQEVIDFCGGLTVPDAVIKLGGPMMGIEVSDLSMPVTKTTNGIIAVRPSVTAASSCIRCGRCVDACPMQLLPLYYPQYALGQINESSAAVDVCPASTVTDCIECGCCDYICPSKIPIRKSIKELKQDLKNR